MSDISSDPELSLWAQEAFQGLVRDTVANAKKAGVIVFHFNHYEEIKTTKSLTVAEKLLRRLAALLGSTLRPGEKLGRLGRDNIALLVIEDEAGTFKAAQRLQHLVFREMRFPIGVGCAHSTDAARSAELGAWAVEAALQGSGDVELAYAGGPAGPKPLEPERSDPPAPPPNPSLEARYQHLVLLNRMSLELFSGQPFAQSFATASHIIMALMECKYVAIHFCDHIAPPFRAFHCGNDPFPQQIGESRESIIVVQALAQRRALLGTSAGVHWRAASFLPEGKSDYSADGVIVTTYPDPQTANEDSVKLLLEIRGLLADARLLQKNREQQKIMAAITEQSADAVILTDLDSHVQLWNPSAQKLFHYSKEEILGRRFYSLIAPEHVEEVKRLEQTLAQTGSVCFETIGVLKDGSPIALEANFTPLHDEAKSAFGMVCVMRDITKRKEIERMKTEFVSLVSHELRTPLTAIQGFAETLFDFQDRLEPAQFKEYLGIIFEESKRLGKLVTNFLDISKLEAGAIELKQRRLDMEDLCRRLMSLFRDHSSGVTIKTDIASDSRAVFADEDQLYRVLVNLCGNALKYSPPKGVVTISCHRRDGLTEISVSDQGPGILPKHREKIFDRFYRIADFVSRKTPGTGLGLAICKSIVNTHGGAIWVDAAQERGACFKFTLPVPPDEKNLGH